MFDILYILTGIIVLFITYITFDINSEINKINNNTDREYRISARILVSLISVLIIIAWPAAISVCILYSLIFKLFPFLVSYKIKVNSKKEE